MKAREWARSRGIPPWIAGMILAGIRRRDRGRRQAEQARRTGRDPLPDSVQLLLNQWLKDR